MCSTLQIHLLGDVHLSLNDSPLTGLKSRTVEGLCIYLACHQKPIARETLYTLFWPTTPEKQAKANLRSALSYLRKHIADYLIVTRQNIGFDPTKKYFVDAELFETRLEKLLANADGQDLSPTQVSELQDSLNLYHGDFLQGFTLDFALGFDEWAVLKRERLHWLAVQSLKKLVDHYLQIGNYQEALRYNSRHLQIDPLDEQIHNQQMWLHVRLGDRHKALSQYATCCQMLQDEFGLQPDPATEKAYRHIRQINLPPPHQLPAYTPLFFGRKTQINELVTRLLRPDNSSFFTLLGMGGSGKSRLATQAATILAQHHAGRFLDGIQFLSLVTIEDIDGLLTALAERLDIKLSGSKPLAKQLIDHLKMQELLLILDNFEHLADNDAILNFIGQLVSADTPGGSHTETAVRLIITSRERLFLQTEQVIRVDGLIYPPTQPTTQPSADPNYEAGHLLHDRVGRITGNHELTNADRQAIWKICHAVEGIPIAIELAAGAAWQKSLSQIASEIQKNIDLLAVKMRDLPPRHRSVRAVFDHSWMLLSPHEQQTLARLSIFPATFSYRAARKIIGATRKDLHLLTDKSFLRNLGDSRFDLHPLLRTFAAEKLHTPAKWHQKHAHYYLTWLVDLEEAINSAAQPQIVAQIARDYANVNSAWHLALSVGNFDLLTATLATLHRYFNTKGGFVTGEKLFRESAEYVENSYRHEQELVLAKLRSRQSWFAYMMGQYEKSLVLQRACIPIFRKYNARRNLAAALSEESSVLRRMGEFEEARILLLECLTLRMLEEDGRTIGFTLLNLASIARALGDIDGSERYLLEAREISKTFDDTSLTATIANDLGEVARVRSDWDAAKAYYMEGLTGYTALDDTFRIGISHNNLGSVSHSQKDFTAACRHAEESIRLFKEAGSYRSLPFPMSILGRTAQDEGKPDEALIWFQEALKLANEYKATAKLLIIMHEMTYPLRQLGQIELAATVLAFLKDQSRLDKTVQMEVTAEFKSLTHKTNWAQAQKQAESWTLQNAVETLLKVHPVTNSAATMLNIPHA